MVLNRYLVEDLKKHNMWNSEMSDQLKYFDGELSDIGSIPDSIKKKYATAFDVSYEFVISAAARRQKGRRQRVRRGAAARRGRAKAQEHLRRAAGELKPRPPA